VVVETTWLVVVVEVAERVSADWFEPRATEAPPNAIATVIDPDTIFHFLGTTILHSSTRCI
jgi:hypothetical protein